MSAVLVQWILSAFLSLAHPYYVSVFQIEHNAKEKSVEVSIRVFAEDLENAVRTASKGKVDLAHPSDKAAVTKLVFDYVNSHLQIAADDKPLQLQSVGYEIQSESAWVYVEAPKVDKLNTLTVKTNFLLDVAKEQVNIIQVKANNKKDSYRLDQRTTSTLFRF